MSLARNSIPLTVLSHSATGGMVTRAFYSDDHSAPQHAGPVPNRKSGVRPPSPLVNADHPVSAPVSQADDVTIFGDHVRQPWSGGAFYGGLIRWRFENDIGPALLPVRQPDGTIKHIPLTTARVP